MSEEQSAGDPGKASPSPRRPRHWAIRALIWAAGLAAAGAACVLIIVGVALAVAYPNLPDISDLSDYRPKLPLSVYSAAGVLIGELGEERCQLTPIGEIPKVMKDAVIAVEDSCFYSHSGVDYMGVMRAGISNL